MTLPYKILIVLTVLLSTYLGAFFHGRSTVALPAPLPPEVRTVGVEHTVYKDRVVTKEITKIASPDGTVITKESETTKDSDRVADKDTSSERQGGQVERNYSAGVLYRVTSSEDLTIPKASALGVRLGWRLIDGLWVQVDATQKDATVGLAIQW